MNIEKQLVEEFEMADQHVTSIIKLLDEGNTIPFIARYRKELTGAVDDQVLRAFATRLEGLRNLEDRREAVQRLISEQGKMTDALEKKLAEAKTLTEVEDIYRPYKPKRKTRASMAIALGLTPLADALLEAKDKESVYALAEELVQGNEEIKSVDKAFAGACDILAERLSDSAEIRQALRNYLWRHGEIISEPGKTPNPVYEQYEEYNEPLNKMAAHRVLAINRAEREEALKVNFGIDEERIFEALFRQMAKPGAVFEEMLRVTAEDAWKRLLKPSLVKEVRKQRTEEAEEVSIDLFKKNLGELLLQAPIKGQCVLGFDPGYRNGCKIAIVDPHGKVLHTDVIYPTNGDKALAKAKVTFLKMLKDFQVSLVVIGNGTASRESERFVAEIVEDNGLDIPWLVVSEAGASVYSASELAAQELPDMNVNLRSAVSIARRVQDPLAELVKIDPKSIGVGQYQHDLNQKNLAKSLDAVVEDCVNHVGVDLNTASAFLLVRVAGISEAVAQNILTWRNENGAFTCRQELLKVPKLGPKAFEQCAGFLRVEGKEPLDNTQVHPESYNIVRQLQKDFAEEDGIQLAHLIEQKGIREISEAYEIGYETLKDIVEALKKPGRDPREDFSAPNLRHDLLDITDLKIGMELDGTVRNIAAFGAFVDIGLHENGLVHISELSDKFIKDPFDVVSIGQNVKVRIITLDLDKKRIGLSMKGLKN